MQVIMGYYSGYSVSELTILFKRIVVSSPVEMPHIFCISGTNRLLKVLLSNDDNEKNDKVYHNLNVYITKYTVWLQF